MPKVRTAESRVSATPLRTPMQRLDSRGAHGEALGSALGEVADIMAQRQAEDDMAVTKERVNQYREFSRNRMFGDDDAYLGRAGRDAYDSREIIADELDKQREGLAKSLSPRQAKLFNDAVRGYMDRDNDNIARHSQRERRSWLNDQDAATVQSAQEDGSLNWQDNEDYGVQIRKTVAQLGSRSGWSDERVELETETRLSAMHMTAIDNILQQNPDMAESYFEANIEDILPSVRDDVRIKIDKQLDTVWAMGVADGIRVGGGTLSERMQSVNEIEDPARRKLVSSQVRGDYQLEKVAQQDARISAYDQALKAIVVGGMNPNQWRAHNFDEWERLSGQQQAALMRPQAQTTTDINAYYHMKGLMATDRDKAREYLATNVHRFSGTDAKKFIDNMFKVDAGVKPSMTNMAAFNDTVEAVLGKEPTKGENRKSWNDRRTIMYGMYQDRLDDWHDENPGAKFIPADERQKVLDDFLIESTREDAGLLWFDKTLPYSKLVDEIPAQDILDITDALREQGLPVTTHNIKEAYEAAR